MSIYSFHLDGHRILFRSADKHVFILNPTADWIWQAMAEGFSFDDLVEQLAEHFQISRSTARSDIVEQLNQWAVLGLNPRPAEQKKDRQPVAAAEPIKLDTIRFAQNAQYSLQYSFHFGSAVITLTDYTSDLAVHFGLLLSGLPATEIKESNSQITLFKDANEYVISCNGVELERTGFELAAVGRVVQAIIEAGYPQAIWMAFMHASAGSLNGYGVVFPGIGGSGKSTLMAALTASGWTYWCDDTVPVDVHGRAGAVPLRPCLKSGSWEVLRSFYPDLDTLPVYQRCDKEVRYLPLKHERKNCRSMLPVHALVFPAYTPGCSQKLCSLTPVEGLQRLIKAQSWISPDPDRTAAMIDWLGTIPTYSLHYHSLDWAITRLEQLAQNGRL